MEHTSLWSQVRIALYSICKFGEKKYHYKRRGEAHLWIFYHPTYRKYIKNSWAIIKRIQAKHGVNMLVKIRPWMVCEEFERRMEMGQSAWTLKAYKAALIKLERGIEHAYGHKVRLFPRDLQLPSTRLTARQGRFAYTPEETAAIVKAAYSAKLPAAALLDLLARTGLRLTEGLRLRARDVQRNTIP